GDAQRAISVALDDRSRKHSHPGRGGDRGDDPDVPAALPAPTIEAAKGLSKNTALEIVTWNRARFSRELQAPSVPDLIPLIELSCPFYSVTPYGITNTGYRVWLIAYPQGESDPSGSRSFWAKAAARNRASIHDRAVGPCRDGKLSK